MKKILVFVISVLMVMPFMNVNAENKVNFYIFYGDGCGYCASLHSYVDELKQDSNYNHMFNVVDYEVWGNQDNQNLLYAVGEYFDVDITGVPFYVIGDKYFVGFGIDSSPQEIENAIKEAYLDDNYKDIVKHVGANMDDYNYDYEDEDDYNYDDDYNYSDDEEKDTDKEESKSSSKDDKEYITKDDLVEYGKNIAIVVLIVVIVVCIIKMFI